MRGGVGVRRTGRFAGVERPRKAVACRECNAAAVCELRPDNVANAAWVPHCRACADARHEAARDVFDHEAERFGGAYGLPTISERGIT